MKKKWTILLAALLCSAAVTATLSGCGNQNSGPTGTSAPAPVISDGAKESDELSLSALRQANDLNAVLKEHTSVTMEITFKDGNGNVQSTGFAQYTKQKNSALYQSINRDTNGNTTIVSEATMTSSAPGAVYTVLFNTDGTAAKKLLTLVPKGEFKDYVSAAENPLHVYHGDNETESQCVLQDGALILETTCQVEDLSDYTFRHYYYVNPKTKLLKASVVETLDKNGNLTSERHIKYVYDKPEKMTASSESILTDTAMETTKLSATINMVGKESESEKVQKYRIAKDATVTVFTKENQEAAIYTGVKDGQPVDPVDSVDLSGDTASIYVQITEKSE